MRSGEREAFPEPSMLDAIDDSSPDCANLGVRFHSGCLRRSRSPFKVEMKEI